MRDRRGWLLLPMLALAAVSLAAVDGRTGAKAATTNASNRTAGRTVGAPYGSRATTILGVAWNRDDTPIKNANLRLRNVVTGKIEAVTKANEDGQFTFENVDGGNYAVELVTDSGRVETVGNVFTIAPGETVATFVRLGPKLPWAAALFNDTAGKVISTAATEGIAVIHPSALCQSPPCH